MKYKDYYAALGVPRDADAETIRKAYRKLAREHHPDVSAAPGAEARFKEIAEAWQTLKDPDKRAAYDELGRRPAGEDFAPPPQWAREFGGGSFEDLDLADLLAAFGRGHGGGAHRARRPAHGRDYESTVRIGLEDAHRGAKLNLQLAGDDGGARTLEVTIPPGVSEGQKLRLRGRGGKGRDGGADGDIYLHITLAPHPVFRPDGHDLHLDLALAPWEAALGADVQVPTLDGPLVLTVPPGTRAGRKLRLRGRGLANGRGGRGDLYAVVHIDVPGALTERERELFKELAAASRFDPRAVAGRGAGS
ncbi:DnaJ domain-containing protein [Ramlibacter sp. RBP-2]|uniref:DnaJ domain-containing protein n=1 Tax=Ramlibacter lithotrophicus TaxID=2606681 RepID=A0A7X6I639_9BURK|nr:DnaJ C-terminal domain-containing protein [Ramlibacter lithotrophicus]NKE65724.1 DnaJ domain-containing protein [Ramlibacter lithotrophicus]